MQPQDHAGCVMKNIKRIRDATPEGTLDRLKYYRHIVYSEISRRLNPGYSIGYPYSLQSDRLQQHIYLKPRQKITRALERKSPLVQLFYKEIRKNLNELNEPTKKEKQHGRINKT